MTLRELYPFWPETHDEIIERLRFIDEAQWNARPSSLEIGSIRRIVARLIRHERLWIGELLLGNAPHEFPSADKMSSDDLISELAAARAITVRAIEGLTHDRLREVRTAPAEPENNEIERNVPLSYIIWRVLAFELTSWGQILLRLSK